MRRIFTWRRIGVLAILTVLIASDHVHAQSAKNGATWYAKAIARYGSISNSDIETITNFDWGDPSALITAELRAALARVQPVLRLARRGTRQEYSDFNLDYSQGFDLHLPHLGRLRGLTQLMRTDALVRMRDGDATAAAAGIASIYRMGAHLNSDQIIISSLVGAAIFGAGDQVAQAGLDRGAFTGDDAQTIFSELERLSLADPFDLGEAIGLEREIMTVWMADQFAAEGGREKIAGYVAPGLADDEAETELRLMDQETFDESIQEVDVLMTQIVGAFMDPDHDAGRARLDTITQKVENGEVGLLAHVLIPSLGRAFERMLFSEEQLRNRMESLAPLITGAVAPKEIANAAVWYLRAIELLAEVEPEARLQWQSLGADPDIQISKEAATSLAGVDSIISTLREGSHMTRCEFSLLVPKQAVAIPAYLPGLKELANLLHAEAVYRFQVGEIEAATDRLEICLRLSAHLGGDRIITTSLISHLLFEGAARLLRHKLLRALLEDDQSETLRAALEQTSRKDPFGYIASIIAARESVRDWFIRMLKADDETQKRVREATQDWDPQRLLALLAIRHAGPWRMTWIAEAEPEQLAPLADVISLDAVAAAASHVKSVQQALAARDIQPLSQRAFPPIMAPLRQQLTNARRDVREVARVLKAYQRESRPISLDN
ncbi:MAG: hypothetical protein V3T84_05470 [Phycisphaerales bacterium]